MILRFYIDYESLWKESYIYIDWQNISSIYINKINDEMKIFLKDWKIININDSDAIDHNEEEASRFYLYYK